VEGVLTVRTSGMDTNERIIYSYIKAAGNKGIWIKDIKSRSQMHTQIVNATVKSLEKKNIIKSVKPVKASL
jgi:DNA-directed RNA polymerase III subunit RPC6